MKLNVMYCRSHHWGKASVPTKDDVGKSEPKDNVRTPVDESSSGSTMPSSTASSRDESSTIGYGNAPLTPACFKMSSCHCKCESTGLQESAMTLVFRFANSGMICVSKPSSVVHTGVKSAGWLQKQTQESPAHSSSKAMQALYGMRGVLVW